MSRVAAPIKPADKTSNPPDIADTPQVEGSLERRQVLDCTGRVADGLTHASVSLRHAFLSALAADLKRLFSPASQG
jgi:hypothetical protein